MIIHTIKKHGNPRHKIPWKLVTYPNVKEFVNKNLGSNHTEQFLSDEEEEIEPSEDEMPRSTSSGESISSSGEEEEGSSSGERSTPLKKLKGTKPLAKSVTLSDTEEEEIVTEKKPTSPVKSASENEDENKFGEASPSPIQEDRDL
jgi:hypothetical protein